MSTSDHRVVLCTCPSAEIAQSLASRLIKARLAACVNIVPAVTSVYEWEGTVHADSEALMVIKTTASGVAALQSTLVEAHPYECPEVIALPVLEGHPDYLAWVSAGVD